MPDCAYTGIGKVDRFSNVQSIARALLRTQWCVFLHSKCNTCRRNCPILTIGLNSKGHPGLLCTAVYDKME